MDWLALCAVWLLVGAVLGMNYEYEVRGVAWVHRLGSIVFACAVGPLWLVFRKL